MKDTMIFRKEFSGYYHNMFQFLQTFRLLLINVGYNFTRCDNICLKIHLHSYCKQMQRKECPKFRTFRLN